VVSVVAVALAFSSVPALAHVPTIEGPVGLETEAGHGGEPLVIGGPEKSRAIYGFLEDGETDTYAFDTSEVVVRTARVIVPDYPEHADFVPTLSLEADGVEVATAEEDTSAGRVSEFEPFSLTHFIQGAEMEFEFEPGVAYVLRVGPGDGDTSGRYVLTFSGPEEFTGADIAGTLRTLPRIWLGAYGGAPARWNTYALIPALFVLAVVGVLVTLAYRALRAWRSGSS
jgi:hypothetical protein